MSKKKLSKKGKIILFTVVGVLLAVLLLNLVVLPLTGGLARKEAPAVYTGTNAYVRYDKGLFLSAHRAGGDIEPEETMRAFKSCMNAPYKVDVVEFDLHLTKDEKLVRPQLRYSLRCKLFVVHIFIFFEKTISEVLIF